MGAGCRKYSRRFCLATICGLAAGAGAARWVGKLGRAPTGPWRVLTPEEAALVDAVSEQIIPADRDPGAREAGVVHFIDRQLDGPYKPLADTYRKGLRCLAQTSQALFGLPFERLDWPDQTRLLRAMESGKVPAGLWTDPSSREFFGLLREHTMQGFYGSPRHGGNKNYVSYRMMGLEYPRVIGQNRY